MSPNFIKGQKVRNLAVGLLRRCSLKREQRIWNIKQTRGASMMILSPPIIWYRSVPNPHLWENGANIPLLPQKNGPAKCVVSLVTRRRIVQICWNSVNWRIMGFVNKAQNDWPDMWRPQLAMHRLGLFVGFYIWPDVFLGRSGIGSRNTVDSRFFSLWSVRLCIVLFILHLYWCVRNGYG